MKDVSQIAGTNKIVRRAFSLEVLHASMRGVVLPVDQGWPLHGASPWANVRKMQIPAAFAALEARKHVHGGCMRPMHAAFCLSLHACSRLHLLSALKSVSGSVTFLKVRMVL